MGRFLYWTAAKNEHIPKASWDSEGSCNGVWASPIRIIADLEVTAKAGRQRHDLAGWHQAGLVNAIVGVGLWEVDDV